MKKCHQITIRVLLGSAIICGLVYGFAVTYFSKEIVEWRIERLEVALKEANPEWHGSLGSRRVDTAGIAILGIMLSDEEVTNLTPLKGMSLTYLILDDTRVADLTPLKDMPLTRLSIVNTKVTDLTPLKGMPLTQLEITGTNVSDLTPLKGMPLKQLWLNNTDVSNLEPLRGMPLTMLLISKAPASEKPLPKWLSPEIVEGHVPPTDLLSLRYNTRRLFLEKDGIERFCNFWEEIQKKRAKLLRRTPTQMLELPDVCVALHRGRGWLKRVDYYGAEGSLEHYRQPTPPVLSTIELSTKDTNGKAQIEAYALDDASHRFVVTYLKSLQKEYESLNAERIQNPPQPKPKKSSKNKPTE